MTEEEYKEFLEYLFRERFEKALARIRRELHPLDRLDRQQSHIPRLVKAMRALRFIEDYFEDEEERRQSLTTGMLDKTLKAVEDGARFNNSLIVDTEIIEVIEEHLTEIVQGMRVEDFPKEDFEILRESGSADPRREIAAIVHFLRSRVARLPQERLEALLSDRSSVRLSRTLQRAPELVEQQRKALTEETTQGAEKKGVKRKIFTGISKICQGTLLSLTDVTAVIGMWHVALSPETMTVGAVTSVTGGVGAILEGVGALRGE
jgi:hypothetical protein